MHRTGNGDRTEIRGGDWERESDTRGGDYRNLLRTFTVQTSCLILGHVFSTTLKLNCEVDT